MPRPFESLEPRLLHDTGLTYERTADRTLKITATSGADIVELLGVVDSRNSLLVRTPAGEQMLDGKRFNRVVFDAGAGNDRITISNHFTKPVTLLGGKGHDRIANRTTDTIGFTSAPLFIPGTALINLDFMNSPALGGSMTIDLGGPRVPVYRPGIEVLGGAGNDVFSNFAKIDSLDGGGGADRVHVGRALNGTRRGLSPFRDSPSGFALDATMQPMAVRNIEQLVVDGGVITTHRAGGWVVTVNIESLSPSLVLALV